MIADCRISFAYCSNSFGLLFLVLLFSIIPDIIGVIAHYLILVSIGLFTYHSFVVVLFITVASYDPLDTVYVRRVS